jgi:hypothetical protein
MSKINSYTIAIPHFYCLEYSEENQKMIIDVDFREKPLYISPSMIRKWEDPYQEISIDEDDKLRIINNIKQYLLEERGFSEVIIEG